MWRDAALREGKAGEKGASHFELAHNDSSAHCVIYNHPLWLEQNSSKASKWAKLARKGHEVAWEFDSPGGSYTGRLLIDGEIYTTSEATNKFLKD